MIVFLMYVSMILGFVFPVAVISAIRNGKTGSYVWSSISMGIIVMTVILVSAY